MNILVMNKEMYYSYQTTPPLLHQVSFPTLRTTVSSFVNASAIEVSLAQDLSLPKAVQTILAHIGLFSDHLFSELPVG